MTYYKDFNRHNNGRYAKRKIDWDKLANDTLMLGLAIWITATFIDITLKAHGL